MAKSLIADRVKRQNAKIKAEAQENIQKIGENKNSLKKESPKEVPTFEEKIVAKKTETLML